MIQGRCIIENNCEYDVHICIGCKSNIKSHQFIAYQNNETYIIIL